MLHFINCMLLTFAPHVIAYKATRLAEESGLRAIVFSGVAYALTQMAKMLVMASCLPGSSSDDSIATASASKDFFPLEEAAKSVISLLEVVGVQYTLSYAPGLSKLSAGLRILAVSLGAAAAESCLKYALPLFLGARALEFDWRFVQMGVASNVAFLTHIAFVTLVWLRTRTDLSRAMLPLLWAALVALCAMPSLDHYLTAVRAVDQWSLLALHAGVGVASAILAKGMFNAYNRARLAAASAAASSAGKKGQ